MSTAKAVDRAALFARIKMLIEAEEMLRDLLDAKRRDDEMGELSLVTGVSDSGSSSHAYAYIPADLLRTLARHGLDRVQVELAARFREATKQTESPP